MPLGLFARAGLYRVQIKFSEALNDLEEAQEIAERGSMRLHLADYHLEAYRLHLTQVNTTGTNKSSTQIKDNIQKSRQHLQTAKTMIIKMGYLRRAPELHLLDTQLCLAQGKKESARRSLMKAKKLIAKMGMYILDRDVEETEKKLEKNL